jgi:hypothetical protein
VWPRRARWFVTPHLLGGLTVANPAGAHRHARRPPKDDEIAIEVPFRLVISPSDEGAAHVTNRPVRMPRSTELWHSRLGNPVSRTARAFTDEKNAGRRIIRRCGRVIATSRQATEKSKVGSAVARHNDPFRMSLDAADRHMLVRQSGRDARLTAEHRADSRGRSFAVAIGPRLAGICIMPGTRCPLPWKSA